MFLHDKPLIFSTQFIEKILSPNAEFPVEEIRKKIRANLPIRTSPVTSLFCLVSWKLSPPKPHPNQEHFAPKATVIRLAVGYPATFSFGLSGPSPAAKNFIPELASYHIRALFTLVTTPENRTAQNVRLLPLGPFRVFGSYPHSDWGNPQLVEIAGRAASWPCHVAILTAGGFFRACLRRHESAGWFWALEWNKSLRVVGGINQPEENNPLFENLPAVDWKPLPDGSGFFRREQGHPVHGDILFPENLRTGFFGQNHGRLGRNRTQTPSPSI